MTIFPYFTPPYSLKNIRKFFRLSICYSYLASHTSYETDNLFLNRPLSFDYVMMICQPLPGLPSMIRIILRKHDHQYIRLFVKLRNDCQTLIMNIMCKSYFSTYYLNLLSEILNMYRYPVPQKSRSQIFLASTPGNADSLPNSWDSTFPLESSCGLSFLLKLKKVLFQSLNSFLRNS